MHVATSFVSPVAARWPSIFAPTYTVLMCPPDASAHGARRKGTLPASPSPLPALLQSRYSNQPARARVIARYSNHSACIAPVDWGGLPPPHRPIPRTCARPHCNELDHPTADPTLEPLPPTHPCCLPHCHHPRCFPPLPLVPRIDCPRRGIEPIERDRKPFPSPFSRARLHTFATQAPGTGTAAGSPLLTAGVRARAGSQRRSATPHPRDSNTREALLP